MTEDIIISDCYLGLARLVKDNKFELIQIQNSDTSVNYKGEANLYYLKRSAHILEVVCSSEHPIVGNCYAMISFCYHDIHRIKKATIWMRKAFCLFFTTLGSSDEVTLKCYNHLLRLEGALSSKYQFLPLEQLAMSLIDYLENEFEEDDDSSQEVDDIETKDTTGSITSTNKVKAIKFN